jgi:uncharacterized protein (DUF1800 family)
MGRRPLRIILALLVWSAAASAFAQQLGNEDARYFLTRTGFAPSPAEVRKYAALTRQQAVDKVLADSTNAAVLPAPPWTEQLIVSHRYLKDKSEEEKKAQREREVRQGIELRGWWIKQMLTTSSPLSERMTLFWHNHFVSSDQKVHYSQLMYRQNALLRRYALGNFGEMLHAVSKDPAMLIYLDGANSRKGAPNENFAREVMELFTLGEGHYGEQDIKEAARAFTGWSIDPDEGEYKWRPFFHDDGVKTVLGKTGNFKGDDVLDILLAQPACAEFIVSKLWREFVSPTPDPAEVKRIAKKFRDSRYDIKTALHELFLSPAFWSEKNRGSLVKSPTELVVGALKQFEFTYDDPLPFTFAVAQLGQNLFSPPDVRGWLGGEDWINTSTLLARKTVLERLFRAVEDGRPKQSEQMPQMMQAMREETQQLGKVKGQGALGREGRIRFANAVAMIGFDPNAWLKQFGARPGDMLDAAQRQAIQKAILPLPPAVAASADTNGLAYVRTLVLDPAYQLK